MNSILTNNIEANSFLGLVTNTQRKTRFGMNGRKVFVKVESKEVFMNLAIATIVIVMGLTIGSISQERIEFAHYATQTTQADV